MIESIIYGKTPKPPIILLYGQGGTKEQFTASNSRFYTNGKTAAFAAYSWYDPRRYLVWNKARQFANLCELFGWEGWTKPPEGRNNV